MTLSRSHTVLAADEPVLMGRRAFLRRGTLVLAAAATVDGKHLFAGDAPNELKIGLVTDLHYADKPPAGSRHYRETVQKLAEASEHFQEARPDFIVELGDLVDAADTVERELHWLNEINRQFSKIASDRHYVLGNHCVDTLTKTEFLGAVEKERSYYSFDRAGWHFVVLDACFRSDGEPYGRKNSHWTDANIPEAELRWLESDLSRTDKPVIVFAHQRLDVESNHAVKNAAAVRRVIGATGRVAAVFQGHSHKNDYREVHGIHYVTLVAMVEGTGGSNNGYSIAHLGADGQLQITGFRNQTSYELT